MTFCHGPCGAGDSVSYMPQGRVMTFWHGPCGAGDCFLHAPGQSDDLLPWRLVGQVTVSYMPQGRVMTFCHGALWGR